MRAFLVGIMIAITFTGCVPQQETRKDYDYMVEIDRIAMQFDKLARQMEKIGEALIVIEKERFEAAAVASLDQQTQNHFDGLFDDLYDVKEAVIHLYKNFETLKNIPHQKTKSGKNLYKEHNQIMEALFKALLGSDEKGDVRTARDFSDVIVEVSTVEGGDSQKISAQELRQKNIFFIFKREKDDRYGYLDTLEAYLKLNLLKLMGRREVTVCVLERKSEGKYTGLAGNADIVTFLGASGRENISHSSVSWIQRFAGVRPTSMWHRTYNIKEDEVVRQLKQAIKARKLIQDFIRGA